VFDLKTPLRYKDLAPGIPLNYNEYLAFLQSAKTHPRLKADKTIALSKRYSLIKVSTVQTVTKYFT